MPSQSLLWRAVLQHLLLLHNPLLGFQDQQVGRIAAKSANFVDYVQKSFVKLGLELKVACSVPLRLEFLLLYST